MCWGDGEKEKAARGGLSLRRLGRNRRETPGRLMTGSRTRSRPSCLPSLVPLNCGQSKLGSFHDHERQFTTGHHMIHHGIVRLLSVS